MNEFKRLAAPGEHLARGILEPDSRALVWSTNRACRLTRKENWRMYCQRTHCVAGGVIGKNNETSFIESLEQGTGGPKMRQKGIWDLCELTWTLDRWDYFLVVGYCERISRLTVFEMR